MLEIVTIPIPEVMAKGKTARKYPFKSLLPGQSFLVPNLDKNPPEELRHLAATRQQVAVSICAVNRRWSVYKMGEDAARVFRYAPTKNGFHFQVWRES